MKLVETDGIDIVAVYDSENGNAPAGCHAITDEDFAMINADRSGFGAFQFVGGQARRKAAAQQAKKPDPAMVVLKALIDQAGIIVQPNSELADALQALGIAT